MEPTISEIMSCTDLLEEAYDLLEKARLLRRAIREESKDLGPPCKFENVVIQGGIYLHGEDWFRGEKWQDDQDHDFENEMLTDFEKWKTIIEQQIADLEKDHASMLVQKAKREADEQERKEKEEYEKLRVKYG